MVVVAFLETGAATYSITWLMAGDVEIGWGMIVDPLSIVMLGLVATIALLTQVYSIGYMQGDRRVGWYFAAQALFVAAMLTLVMADNLLFLYIAWELVGLGSYLLIGYWWERRSAAEAAKKAFVTTRIGDVGLLIGIILLFRATGTFDLSTIFHIAASVGIGDATLNASAALIFIGAMGKSAQFPLHIWLPDAMEGPTPVSALLHAATMVAAGVYLVARLMPMFELVPGVMVGVAIVGLVTFLIGGTLALVMTDIKRVLAYSTMSHLGLMMCSLGAGALFAALMHLFAHAIAKALLFFGAGNVMHSCDDETDIWKLRGLRRKMPITALTFVIGAASLAGIPPLAGFFSKDEILLGSLEGMGVAFVVLLLAGSFLSALYMTRLTVIVFFGQLGAERDDAHEPSWVMWAPLVLLAILALGGGLVVILLSGGDLGTFSEFSHPYKVHSVLIALSAVLAGSGLAVGWVIYGWGRISHAKVAESIGPVWRLAARGYLIDDACQWVIDRVVLALAAGIALFDRVVVNDTGVDGPADSVRLSALRVRTLQTGRLFTYGAAMALGAVVLAVIWWSTSA